MGRAIFRLIPPFIISSAAILAVTYLSLMPSKISVDSFFGIPFLDKVAHILLYFGLTSAVLVDYGKLKRSHHTTRKFEWLIACICAFYGLIMEVAQLLMDYGRQFSYADEICNIFGCLLAIFLFQYYLAEKVRKAYRRKHHHRDIVIKPKV